MGGYTDTSFANIEDNKIFKKFLDFVSEKFIYRPTSNAKTNQNPVSKQPGGKHIKMWVFTMWFSYDFVTSTIAVKSLLWPWIPVYILFPDTGPCLQPFLAIDIAKFMKNGSTWYSTGSSRPDLPNGRKISGWLYWFLCHGVVQVWRSYSVCTMFHRGVPRYIFCNYSRYHIWVLSYNNHKSYLERPLQEVGGLSRKSADWKSCIVPMGNTKFVFVLKKVTVFSF